MDLGERDHRPRRTSTKFGSWEPCGGGVPGALVIQAIGDCPRGIQDHIELAGLRGPFRPLAISGLRHRLPLGPQRRCDSVRGYFLARRAWRSGERFVETRSGVPSNGSDSTNALEKLAPDREYLTNFCIVTNVGKSLVKVVNSTCIVEGGRAEAIQVVEEGIRTSVPQQTSRTPGSHRAGSLHDPIRP